MTGKLLLGGALVTGLYFALRKKETPAITVEDVPYSELPPQEAEVLPELPFSQQATPTLQMQPAQNSNMGCCYNLNRNQLS